MAKTEATKEELQELQKERLELAGIHMTIAGFKDYLKWPDILEECEDANIEIGYKRCGGCSKIKKLYLFNKNSGSKTGCTGTCKDCQKKSAKKSYKKTKRKRNYKKYYQENREIKREAARRYYEAHKEELDAKHKIYVTSKKGKAVMQKARDKRNALLEQNLGIPYDRDIIDMRDRDEHGVLSCYLCGEPIEDITKAHIDHVIGLNIGGANCLSNVMLVHAQCNLKKSKDCREVMPETTEDLVERTEQFMDLNPELF